MSHYSKAAYINYFGDLMWFLNCRRTRFFLNALADISIFDDISAIVTFLLEKGKLKRYFELKVQ